MTATASAQGASAEGDNQKDHQKSAPAVPKLSKTTAKKSTPAIIFDVEMTSLSTHADMVQLTACTTKSNFWKFALSATAIYQQASKVTCLTVNVTGDHRQLLKDGQPVASMLLAETLRVHQVDKGSSRRASHFGCSQFLLFQHESSHQTVSIL